jgi:hypothetical protein
MADSGSCHIPHSADITSPKHVTVAPLGNHAGGSILAAKVAQFLTAIDNLCVTRHSCVAFVVLARMRHYRRSVRGEHRAFYLHLT